MVPAQHWYVTILFKDMQIGFPFLVMLEYSQIMEKILEYLNLHYQNNEDGNSLNKGKDDKAKNQPPLQQLLLGQLIEALNSKWFTLIWLFLIHFAMLTFKTSTIALYNGMIFMAIIAVKLWQYCNFMDR